MQIAKPTKKLQLCLSIAKCSTRQEQLKERKLIFYINISYNFFLQPAMGMDHQVVKIFSLNYEDKQTFRLVRRS
jgi:hypothetical protein